MSETYNMEELGQPFKLELEFGVLKAGMKENGAGSNELWEPPIAKLRPVDGFNVRVKNAAYWTRVRKYADSLKKHGYLPHKPMAGYVGRDPQTGEDVLFYTAGYTRMDAVALANSELPAEKQITHVTMVVHSRKTTTPTQLNALLITENEAAPYNAYEASVVCKRMLDDGNSVEEIAALVNYTTVWVEALLKLAAAPIELQRMVVDDVIKPTFAIETIEAHGDKALAVLQEALARKTGVDAAPPAGAASTEGVDNEGEDGDGAPAPASNKVRLTAKDLIKPEVRKFNNAMKKQAPVMYKTLTGLTTDPEFGSLAPEMREKVLDLVKMLKELEAGTDEPSTDPRQSPLFDATAADDAASEDRAPGAAVAEQAN